MLDLKQSMKMSVLCKKCQKDKRIVNKTYGLCEDCNFARLHKGKNKFECHQEKQSIYNKRMQVKALEKAAKKPKEPAKPIKQVSDKKKKENAIYSRERVVFLNDNSECQAKLEGCTR